MRNVLLIGAGKSSSSLIKFLLEQSKSESLFLTIADQTLDLANRIIQDHPNAKTLKFDLFNEIQRQSEIQKADLVISMLPARFHIEVAKDCIHLKKHLVTASYVSDEMKALHEDAVKHQLVFMNEIGVDPGIDHMSAMQVIDRIKSEGGKMELF